ncbi:hypothetical protein CXB37_21630 [Pseudomonas syringae pv. syringae]|nr:hypothetical protein CXB37_21630 [Pseudomonas syringae pv. syringae]
MPFRTLCVLLATQSVETCIPTLEREERSPRLSCDAPRRMPFWTLCVLLTTQSVETCIPTLWTAPRKLDSFSLPPESFILRGSGRLASA